MKSSFIIADAHVHFYDCFDSKDLLDSAFNNFRKEIKTTLSESFNFAFIFLTETKSEKGFKRFLASAQKNGDSQNGEFGKWTLQTTQEDCSLFASSTGNETKGIYLISGRQIITEESLEILALGTIQEFEHRKPLAKLIRLISQSGALPVIPWGVGKWTGRRGELIKQLLDKKESLPFFLGDNGNRPLFWPRSQIFKQAEKKGIALLPGSDPLPFPSESRRIGRSGFKVTGSINSEYPFQGIKKLLLLPVNNLQAYGPLENPFRFFWNQYRMRAKKNS